MFVENICMFPGDPRRRVKADCMQMAEWLETLTVDEDNHFTIDDINIMHLRHMHTIRSCLLIHEKIE